MDESKLLARVREICAALEDVSEGEAWHHPVWKSGGKTFLAFEQTPCVAFRLERDEVDILTKDRRFHPTPHGRGQWVSLRLGGRTENMRQRWQWLLHVLRHVMLLPLTRRRVSWVAVCGIVMFGVSPLAGCARSIDAHRAVNSDCGRFDLQPRPSWLFWGEWSNDGTQLILPDMMTGRLLRYDRSGDFLRPLPAPATSAAFVRPNAMTNSKRGLVVLDLVDHLVRLKSDLQPAWDVRLGDVPFADGDRVEAFLSFVDDDPGFVGITVLANERTHEKWLGIARLQFGDTPRVERLRTVPSMFGEEGSFYFSHAGPYIARASGAVYALFFGQNPHIERIVPDARTLTTFPRGYKSPVLGLNTRENTESSFRVWEAAAAPVALFGRGAFLYLLARRPEQDRGTQWMLFQIDPERDEMVRSIELPTHATHVLVIPGPREWAIVEKGRVAAAGSDFEQPVGPILFIRSSMIENPTAPGNLAACLHPGQ